MKHTYSIETLYHFNCGFGTKWWSIGDFDITKKNTIICPYCGEECELKQK